MSNQFDKQTLKSCGKDVFISERVEIRRPHLVSIGSHIAIDSGFYCTVNVDIGDYVHIAPYVTVIGGEKGRFKMDHFSSLAAGARVICGGEKHQGEGLVGPTIPTPYKDEIDYSPVIIERFASVGTNAVVMPGVTVAEGSVVAIGSVVTASTKPWTIYVGNPARPFKVRPKEKMISYAKAMGYE